VNSCTDASGSKPRSNTKKNRISSATSVNMKTVEDHPKTTKSNLQKSNRVDSVPAKQPENVSTSKIVVTENLSHTSQKPLTSFQRRNKLNKVVPAGIPTPTDTSMQPVVISASQLESNNNWGSNCLNSPSLSVFKCRSYRSSFEVAFRKHTCFVRDLDGINLIKGSRGSNLYTIFVEDMMRSSPICLLSKALKNKSWLWHHRLNHLNFGTINNLAQKDLVRGLPRLKFEKDHLCSAFQLEREGKQPTNPKRLTPL
nr:integrase, catalytic region, zinc finger, CCHC-type, peptidase aspartic, catalytic [Tanacetum cinerariifolium]